MKKEINDYLSKCDEDLANNVMYRVYGMPGPIFMEEDNDTPTPEPPTPPPPGQPNDEVWYTSTNGEIIEPAGTFWGSGVTIVSNTYSNGKGIIKLSADATTVPYQAFLNKSTLLTISLPNSITTLNMECFEGCTSLTSLNIPTGVTTIPDRFINRCAALTSIIIPNTVTSTGTTSFGQSGLTSIVIPSSVTTIGKSSFANCESLTSVTVESTTPPTLGNNNVFYSTTCTIYVPASSVDTYKEANYWSNVASRIQPIPSA